ncbi:hypothetical protein TTHERM_00344210 (macronuclear) [Tetrahymena thermophila SB210]|uniref:Uncharacterized protein n=1 Tax=Tetrahymena thermophila (strain SB210) TaxID=312017 RepID=I7MF01_TETTS|nr:hypothetical protein TTHERM_00344210 [Tetrahymena thermophila SB210]EAR98221.2 hypothetical protein TTHERM_00344210 [Tetrahymena thermophila SB210]|eukprot:XP_001018466.2 hypothetical protein TTHERM_00344210 [Tetrahymena thermophila SB210]
MCVNVDQTQQFVAIQEANNECIGLNEQISLEGIPQSIFCPIDDNICYDSFQGICQFLDDNQNISGIAFNRQCAISGLFYSSIVKCNKQYCKKKQNPNNPYSQEGCFPFDINVQTVGIDQNGYCVQQDQPNAVWCISGQFCLDDQNGNACKSLTTEKKLNRYARQSITGFCLPYLDPLGQGDQIETCVTGTCIYTNINTSMNYCIIMGNMVQGNLVTGVDIYQQCLNQDQITSHQIASCFGLSLCILQIGGGLQKCQTLQDFDPNFPNLIYRSKNSNQYCQDLNMPNSIGCMDGMFCINTDNNNKCEAMSSPTDLNKIGRDSSNQQCLPQSIILASKCQQQFCISMGECIPLSDQNPGKEKDTHLCLPKQNYGKYGASNCYTKGYCLQINSNGLAYCVKLDFENPNLIGIQKDTQLCIKQNQPIAIMCAQQQFCINPLTLVCQLIDLSKGMCVDQNGMCAFNGSCFRCHIDQCLSSITEKKCQDLIQPYAIYCTDYQGVCADLNKGTCLICPQNYCDIQNSGACINSNSLLRLIVGNSCITQLKNFNNKCVLQSMDFPDSNGDMLCTNNQGFCQKISQNNRNCLLCPQYYINPGNDVCYSLEEKSHYQSQDYQLFFDMKLQYIKQDCYDQQFCLHDPSKKCPKGCFSCTSPSFCTQCIQGYFLYQASSVKQICIQCRSDIYQYTEVQQFYLQTPTYTCLDCSAESELWNQPSNSYKTCKNYIVYFDSNVQILQGDLEATNFLVQSISGSYQLTNNQINLCQNSCQSCVQASSSSVSCIKCQKGYVLNDGVCEKCPSNCENCQYATFISGFAQFKDQINYDSSQLQYFNFILICIRCKDKFIVSYDLLSCQKCEANCDECQYENQDEVLNFYTQKLTIVTQNEFALGNYIKKCIKCKDGFSLFYDGLSCVENIQNCDYNSLLVSYGQKQFDLTENLWTYNLGSAYSGSIQICKQCSINYYMQTDQSSCFLGCSTNSKDCSVCTSDLSSNIICQFCSASSVLDIQRFQCKQDKCQNNIFGCSECYQYFDSQSKQNVYQCTKCNDQFSIPSINGCLKCPQGCSKCYEGTRTFNFTSQLVYKRTPFNIQERINYNSTINNYQLFCTECQEGYYFDQQYKRCNKIKCGQYCLQCVLINNKPQCIKCNYDSLSTLINQFFVGMLYFKKSYIPNFQSMISFTQDGDDCQICPIMCETCIQNKDVTQNPLYLYDAECFSCRNNLPSSYVLNNYQITYDKDRRKCYLCQKEDQGCFYRKQQSIYVQCLDINSRLGDGTRLNPINYNRLNEANIDQLILNEINFDEAIIFYNELQVNQQSISISDINLTGNTFLSDTIQAIVQIENINTVQLTDVSMVDNIQFVFIKVKSSENILISNIQQTQTKNQQNTPQICQLQEITNYININNVKLSNINIQNNLIVIQNALIIQDNIKLYINNKYPKGIFLNGFVGENVNLIYNSNMQNASPVSINSKQDILVDIQNVVLSNSKYISDLNKISLGQVSFGFYFQAPTVSVAFKNSKFLYLDTNSPFNWISGAVKQISFLSCQFENQDLISQQSYLNTKTSKNGGFIQIISEIIIMKQSYFIGGLAINGGAIYWISQNKGNLYMFNCTFSNNMAFHLNDFETQGGALFIDGLLSWSQDIFISQTIFSTNFAVFKGGALQIKSSASPRIVLIIEKSEFIDNFSLQGGNLNFESQAITKAAVLFKNIVSKNKIETLTKQYEITSHIDNLIQKLYRTNNYLFSIQEVYEVDIENSSFQIFCENISQIDQSQIKNQIFQKMLFIENAYRYQEMNNIYQKNTFLNNLVNITQVQIINIYNATVSNNQNIINKVDLSSPINQIQNIFYLNSQICTIYQLNSSYNVCRSCQQGIIQIIAQEILIENSSFQNNIALHGSSLYLSQTQTNSQKDKQNKFQIQNSYFKNNEGLINGGAIFLKSSSLQINQSVFYKNIASISGGAIYLENDQKLILINQIELTKNIFAENQSQYGGAIASQTCQSVNKYSNNTFILNKALYYGQNIKNFPTKLNLYLNKTLLKLNQPEYRIKNHQGGHLQENIAFKLSNDENEELTALQNNATLNVKIISGKGILTNNKIKQQNGVFNLTQQIELFSIFNELIVLEITSDLIQTTEFNSQEQVIGYSLAYSFLIYVQMGQSCLRGSTPNQVQNEFYKCNKCIDSYNLDGSNACYPCPNQEVLCQGDQILLSPQYWRANQNSSVLYKCKNCVGDYKLYSKSDSLQKSNVLLTDQNYYCKEGHIGALCEDCDRIGLYWGEPYYMNLNQKCQKYSLILAKLQYPNTEYWNACSIKYLNKRQVLFSGVQI